VIRDSPPRLRPNHSRDFPRTVFIHTEVTFTIFEQKKSKIEALFPCEIRRSMTPSHDITWLSTPKVDNNQLLRRGTPLTRLPHLTYLFRNRASVAGPSATASYNCSFHLSYFALTITMSVEIDPPELGFKRKCLDLGHSVQNLKDLGNWFSDMSRPLQPGSVPGPAFA